MSAEGGKGRREGNGEKEQEMRGEVVKGYALLGLQRALDSGMQTLRWCLDSGLAAGLGSNDRCSSGSGNDSGGSDGNRCDS